MERNKSLLKPFQDSKGYAIIIVKVEWKAVKSGPVVEKAGESDYFRLHTSGGVHFFFFFFLTNPVFVPPPIFMQ